VPSFMLMDVQGMSLVLYIYTLDNGQIKVEKVHLEFRCIPNCSCRIERESHDGISPSIYIYRAILSNDRPLSRKKPVPLAIGPPSMNW
jgi:hypothetical protein